MGDDDRSEGNSSQNGDSQNTHSVERVARIQRELDAADAAIESAKTDADELQHAAALLENAGELLAAAGANPTARASYRPPPAAEPASDNTASEPVTNREMLRFEFLQLKLAHRAGRARPAQALTQLVRLLQSDRKLSGGKELYGELTQAAHKERTSNLAFSHPPPPVAAKGR